jgi:serine/threonine protein kinase
MKIRGGRVHVADTVKLSNMLLNQGVVKLCDYGCAAWMSETKYPTAFSVRWCSPYRLGSNQDINPRPLIPEEDIYASAITVWELFVGENPYGPFVSQDDEFELWDRIV